MMETFTYAVLWRSPEALPRLVELLPEAARAEVNRIAGEARSLTPAELESRISELRNRELAQMDQNCPANVLEWKYRRHVGGKL